MLKKLISYVGAKSYRGATFKTKTYSIWERVHNIFRLPQCLRTNDSKTEYKNQNLVWA